MRYFLLFLSLVVSPAITAQKKTPPAEPKKALDHTVYDNWKEITYKELTPDGAYAVFTINPQDGDGKVVFHSIKSGSQEAVPRAANISLTFDSKYAIFKIKPQQEVVKELRRQKKKKEDLPKDSLGIYSFATQKTEKLPNIKSFQVPEKTGGWLAYQLEPQKEEKPKGNEKSDSPSKTKKAKKNGEENGYTLVLRKMSDGKETAFGYVKDYQFAKYGQGLLFSTTGNDSTLQAGVYWLDLNSEALKKLHQGHAKYKYKGLAISEQGDQAAFVADVDTTKAPVRHFQLYHWKKENDRAQLLEVEKNPALPSDWIVSEHRTPIFSKNGDKLFFGTAPIPVVQDTTLLTEEIVSVEIWHGDDPYIYPMQNVRLENEKKRSYLAAINLGTSNMIQMGNEQIPTVEPGTRVMLRLPTENPMYPIEKP